MPEQPDDPPSLDLTGDDTLPVDGREQDISDLLEMSHYGGGLRIPQQGGSQCESPPSSSSPSP